MTYLMSTYAPPGVTFVRGQGSYLWDEEGRRYLDFLSGLAVTSLGHAHPAVAEAVCGAANTLLHTSNLFGTLPREEVAGTLDRLIGGGGKVFFANSGAEANECAIKLARKWAGHGRYVVLSAYGSFHGRTLATLHATGQPAKHEAFQPLPDGFRHVAWQDIEALERAVTPEVAAVLLEPVQGEGGIWPAGPGVLPGRAPAVRPAAPSVHGRRGPDRPRPHRSLVGFSALRGQARRRHRGQGAGQRRAHRGVLGTLGGSVGVRARGPRVDVRRPAVGRIGGSCHSGGDGGRGCPGPGRRRGGAT